MLDTLGGSLWFSVLDQGKAYHQRLSSAPAEFQRNMEHCLTSLRDTVWLPYLDDNLVHSGRFDEHLEHVCIVLQRYK